MDYKFTTETRHVDVAKFFLLSITAYHPYKPKPNGFEHISMVLRVHIPQTILNISSF